MQANARESSIDQPSLGRDEFVRRLSVRYFTVLAAVLALIVADQALIQPLLMRMHDHAPVINVAGRQRMLSQKLAKGALALQLAQDEPARAIWRRDLRDSLAQWTIAHDALRRGDVERGIAHLTSPAIDETWRELEPHFVAMRRAAERLGGVDSLPANEQSNAVATIVEHEPQFLQTMNRIVRLLEDHAGSALRRLRALALLVAGAIVVLVCALGWFVIRPATREIRGQVSELEKLVSQRTRKLDEMLAALRSEIAERQAIEERSQALAAQLAHANRVQSVGHLAAGLAHELNHPFATIVNYTEACSLALAEPVDEPGRQRLRDLVERVRLASLRAGGIVRRIRGFVRPGAGSVMPVELVALVHEVVELCRAEAQRADTSIIFQPPATGEIVLEADPIQIQQVLVNLIQNALHAMIGDQSQDRMITLRIESHAETVQFDVVDSGPGLGEVDAESLFAPFYTTKADGLGIGLSLCRSIIERHGGTIWAQSLSARGAQFSFVLPKLICHVAENQRQADRVCR